MQLKNWWCQYFYFQSRRSIAMILIGILYQLGTYSTVSSNIEYCKVVFNIKSLVFSDLQTLVSWWVRKCFKYLWYYHCYLLCFLQSHKKSYWHSVSRELWTVFGWSGLERECWSSSATLIACLVVSYFVLYRKNKIVNTIMEYGRYISNKRTRLNI